MTEPTATASLDLTFRSPAKAIKIEFQGGESLLNFSLIQKIVFEAEQRNKVAQKDLQFVIATNLAVVTPEMLEFCAEHDINISTSLDGPRNLHNKNRPRPGGDSYERVSCGIRIAREIVGRDNVSALMTTTEDSLSQPEAIIDEYLLQEFHEIFLRPLSPYGFAMKTKGFASYNGDRWLNFYKKGLKYIIELNRKGIAFREHYAALVLKKMLTCDDPGYVDLMNPAGIGIAAVVYNYDGAVYASDEGRMLAEMKDYTFRIGNVNENTYEEIFLNDNLLTALHDSFTLSAPRCSECAFEPYCGADPVFHHAQYGDYLGHKSESMFCNKNMAIFKFLIDKMDQDPFVKDLFCIGLITDMLQLGGRALRLQGADEKIQRIFRLSDDAELPFALRPRRAYLVRKPTKALPVGFAAYVALPPALDDVIVPDDAIVVHLPDAYSYLASDDIVRINFAEQTIKVLFRAKSPHNFLLVTEHVTVTVSCARNLQKLLRIVGYLTSSVKSLL